MRNGVARAKNAADGARLGDRHGRPILMPVKVRIAKAS